MKKYIGTNERWKERGEDKYSIWNRRNKTELINIHQQTAINKQGHKAGNGTRLPIKDKRLIYGVYICIVYVYGVDLTVYNFNIFVGDTWMT